MGNNTALYTMSVALGNTNITQNVLKVLSRVNGIIWVLQFIIGVVCIFLYRTQQKYNPYLYFYTILFTFKWLLAVIIATSFTILSLLVIKLFWLSVGWQKFKSGWITQFIIIIGVLLMISVPTGLHALHVSRHLPLVFTIFIYLEVFMSALHVIQVLVDRILHVYSNDRELMEELESLPTKPKEQLKPIGKFFIKYYRTGSLFSRKHRFQARKSKSIT
jgi:hypothetical protein